MIFSFPRFFALSSSSFVFSTFLFATDIDPKALITENVSQVCTSPENAGNRWDIRVRSDGEAAIKLKLPDNLGVTGRSDFSAQEWSDIRATVEESASPEECSEALVPLFIERFASLLEELIPKEEKPSKSLGGMTWLDFKGGIDFTLLGCDVKSETITWALVANSLDDDVKYTIYGNSAVYDHLGRQYFMSYGGIANSKDSVPPSSGNSGVTADLLK